MASEASRGESRRLEAQERRLDDAFRRQNFPNAADSARKEAQNERRRIAAEKKRKETQAVQIVEKARELRATHPGIFELEFSKEAQKRLREDPEFRETERKRLRVDPIFKASVEATVAAELKTEFHGNAAWKKTIEDEEKRIFRDETKEGIKGNPTMREKLERDVGDELRAELKKKGSHLWSEVSTQLSRDPEFRRGVEPQAREEVKAALKPEVRTQLFWDNQLRQSVALDIQNNLLFKEQVKEAAVFALYADRVLQNQAKEALMLDPELIDDVRKKLDEEERKKRVCTIL